VPRLLRLYPAHIQRVRVYTIVPRFQFIPFNWCNDRGWYPLWYHSDEIRSLELDCFYIFSVVPLILTFSLRACLELSPTPVKTIPLPSHVQLLLLFVPAMAGAPTKRRVQSPLGAPDPGTDLSRFDSFGRFPFGLTLIFISIQCGDPSRDGEQRPFRRWAFAMIFIECDVPPQSSSQFKKALTCTSTKMRRDMSYIFQCCCQAKTF
jgi:hypothetical protein